MTDDHEEQQKARECIETVLRHVSTADGSTRFGEGMDHSYDNKIVFLNFWSDGANLNIIYSDDVFVRGIGKYTFMEVIIFDYADSGRKCAAFTLYDDECEEVITALEDRFGICMRL